MTGFRSLRLWAARIAVAIVVLLIWIGYIRLANIPSFVLPHPANVATKLVQQIASGEVLPHVLATALEALLGFVTGSILAVLIGTLISRSQFIEDVLRLTSSPRRPLRWSCWRRCSWCGSDLESCPRY